MSSDNRKRNWTFIVYPDSAPKDWLKILHDEHVQGFVSPLHDKDCNPTGEVKKAHYHVMLIFSGNKSEKQVQEISDLISGVKVQSCKDIRGMARYLCHLDNPEKYQYSIGEVVCLAGADYFSHLESASDTDQALAEIEDFIDKEDIVSYKQLCQYARIHRKDWYRVITSRRTLHISQYLRSAVWEKEHPGFLKKDN